MLLKLENLSISFSNEGKNLFELKDISYSVQRGKCLGIVGESGSGKSLSSLALMGLLPKKAILVSGNSQFSFDDTTVDLLSLKESQIREIRGNKISMIFQEPMTSLNPVLTCGYQVAEVMETHLNQNHKEGKKNTIELFKEVDLPRPENIFDSYPHQLSGGQQQRVMIAMAIACKPDLLIADEPTTALDVSVQKNILKLLNGLKERYNMGIIFISHDLGVISEMADEVVVMNKGRIVETGITHDILTKPKENYTKGLLACISGLKNYTERLPVVEDFIKGGFIKPSRNLQSDKKENKVILEVNNLKTYFTTKKLFKNTDHLTVKAVNDVSFNVFEGETLGLVGESGCGKTSLGRTIINLIDSTSGSVKYKGEIINNLSKREFRKLRRQIQIIFQDPYSSLNPGKSIGETILEPMISHGLANRKSGKLKVFKLLEKVGLNPESYSKFPHEFSGGQRQRIGIARALALDPEFIICDESVSALDVSVQAQVLNLLNDLKSEFSLTYIFISHDLNVVRYMSDRLIIMKNGNIVESGNSDEIFKNPATDYTRMLIDSIPEI